MRYAMIEDCAVVNIIWLDPANAGEFQTVVPIGEVAAGIGDTYADGAFWRDGKKLLTPLEAAEANVAALDAAVLELEYQNALLALGLS